MERYPDSHIGAANLYQSRLLLAKEMGRDAGYTPPAPGHYWDLYTWDEVFHDTIDARHGSADSIDAAETGLRTLLRGVQEDGFLPNTQHLGPKRPFDLERLLAFDSSDHSNYTQPPVLAQGAIEVYLARVYQKNINPRQALLNADEFLADIYEPLKLHYEYFDTYRSNGADDKLVGDNHPHGTGRDSGPEWDNLIKHRLPRNGSDTPLIVDKVNAGLDYAQIIWFGMKFAKASHDMEKSRGLFWVNDVMTNSLYVQNLYLMAQLAEFNAKPADANYFSALAHEVEDNILSKMWFPDERDGDGVFYGLNKGNEPIREVTVANLMPLLLPNLKEDQLESILKLIDRSFNTRYGLPSVATDSPNYDPHYREFERLWRGPVWMNAVWEVAEGLLLQVNRPDLNHRPDLKQQCGHLIGHLGRSSREVVDLSVARGRPLPEFVNPITAEGQRKRVKGHGWTSLAYVMPTSTEAHLVTSYLLERSRRDLELPLAS